MKLPSVSVVFFYCKHLDNERNMFPALARSILIQLLKQNGDLLSYLYDKSMSSGQVSLASGQLCRELLDVTLNSASKTYIIIDGIDECDANERKAILSCFTTIIEKQPQPGNLRCLIVSQDENDIKKLLQMASVVRLKNDGNKADIENFTRKWTFKIQQKFELSEEYSDLIMNIVANRADGKHLRTTLSVSCSQNVGMFLFAKLVLKNLYGQTTRAQLFEELQPEKFPTGLAQA